MGSPKGELCALSNEQQHRVTLTRDFYIGSTEVTQSQFTQILGTSPSSFASCGATCPVDSVTWSMAAYYCNLLSAQAKLDACYLCDAKDGKVVIPPNCQLNPKYTGLPGKTIYQCPGYRLPTEAEWEYAYRAGTKTALYTGGLQSCYSDPAASAIAWHHANAGKKTHPVARLTPNAWGLYDMAGNAWEWVNDWYVDLLGTKDVVDPTGPQTGPGKVLKGGSFTVTPGGLRAAARQNTPFTLNQNFLGFRVVRSINP